MRVFKSAGKTELFEKTLASKPHCARIDTATSKCCICFAIAFHWLKSFANESSSWQNFSTCRRRQDELTGYEKYNKNGRASIIWEHLNPKVIVAMVLNIWSLKKEMIVFQELSQLLSESHLITTVSFRPSNLLKSSFYWWGNQSSEGSPAFWMPYRSWSNREFHCWAGLLTTALQ